MKRIITLLAASFVGFSQMMADPTAQDIPGTLTLSNSTINPNNAGKTGLNNDGTATSDIKHNGTITFVLNNTTEQNYKISFKACTNRAAASVKFTLSNGTTISERTVKIDNTGWNNWRDYACYTGTIPVSGSVSLVVTFMDGSAGTNNTANIKDVVFTALTTDADRMMQIPTDDTHPFDPVFATYTGSKSKIETDGHFDSFQNNNTATININNLTNQYYKISFGAATNFDNTSVKFTIKQNETTISDGDAVAISKNGWNSYGNYECYTKQALPTGNLTVIITFMRSNGGNTVNVKNISFTALDNVALDESESYTPEAKFANVTLTRSIAANKWSTICLPFDMTAEQVTATFGADVNLATLTSGDASTLYFSTATTIEANQPYAIKVATDFASATIDGVTIKTGTTTQTVGDWQFVGNYTKDTAIPENSYFFSNNKLYKAADGTNKVQPFRGYFAYTGSVEARGLNFIIDGETTALTLVNSEKRIMNSEVYDLQGRRVAQPTKGLYIVNGKKVIIK